MKAYSLDLRERVVRAVDQGGVTIRQIAERFGVGTTFIKKLLKRRRETGSIAAKSHGGGTRAKYAGPMLELLLSELAKKPDATLRELRDRTLQNASLMAVSRALKRLELARRKTQAARSYKSGSRLSGAEARDEVRQPARPRPARRERASRTTELIPDRSAEADSEG